MVAEALPSDLRGILYEIHERLAANEIRRPSVTPFQHERPRDQDLDINVPDEYRGIVDEALMLVYSQHHRIISRLYPAAMIVVSIEQLREGPLGEDLSRLAQIAMGAMRASRAEITGAIDSVLQLLFWPVGAETYTVPRSFWYQPLGKMLSLAKLRSFQPDDLMSIGTAANLLNVKRPTLYRWMDDKSLDYVRDDMSNRTFLVREDVEAMKADMDAAERALRGENVVEDAEGSADDGGDEDDSSQGLPTSVEDIPVQQSLVALAHALNRIVHDDILAKSRKPRTEPVSLAEENIVALQLNESPLTSQSVGRLTSALTSLHTKLWLTTEGRYADLIDFNRAQDTRFIAEANLVITRVSYNSPFSINIDPGKMGDAFREGVDAVVQLDLRRKERKARIAEIESNVQIQQEQAKEDRADQRQERRIARQQAEAELERTRIALQRERSELLRYELEMVPLLMQTAMMMVTIRQPNLTDPVTKELVARTYIPELLELHGIEGLSRLLPAPRETPTLPSGLQSAPQDEQQQ